MTVEETEDTITVRIQTMDHFAEETIRTIIISDEMGIQARVGRPKGGDDTDVQAYLFSKTAPEAEWTQESAVKWVKEHGETPKALASMLLEFKAGVDASTKSVVLDFDIVTRKENGKDLEIEGWASNEDVDRDKEIVEVTTMDISEFEKNPLLLYQHNPDKPIGKVVHIEKRKDPEDSNKEQLWVKAIVSGETDLGAEVIRLIKAGVLRAFSVGARGAKRIMHRGATILRGLKLFELSIVSIPANPEALFQTSKDLAPHWNKVSDIQIAKAINTGLASTANEARYFKAMEMAISQSQSDKEKKDMTETGEATNAGGQDKKQEEAPAIPESIAAELEAMKTQIADLTERVAALEGSTDDTPDETKGEEPENAVKTEAGTKKSVVSTTKKDQKKLDVKKMSREQRKALAKEAFFKLNPE